MSAAPRPIPRSLFGSSRATAAIRLRIDSANPAKQSFDGESKPEGDNEVSHFNPPSPMEPSRALSPEEASASRNSGRNRTSD